MPHTATHCAHLHSVADAQFQSPPRALEFDPPISHDEIKKEGLKRKGISMNVCAAILLIASLRLSCGGASDALELTATLGSDGQHTSLIAAHRSTGSISAGKRQSICTARAKMESPWQPCFFCICQVMLIYRCGGLDRRAGVSFEIGYARPILPACLPSHEMMMQLLGLQCTKVMSVRASS